MSTAGSGFLSHLADTTEAMQLDTAAELLEHAREVLGYGEKEPNELQLIALDMMGALCDVLRVAISRGHRLALTEPPACE
ncbi:hypothetical protein [Streptomyces lydicus]|uniref:hypothetical protein n=1 Tax=Streptomyces lydicus TaxID=47763 RepID=UPI0036F6B321